MVEKKFKAYKVGNLDEVKKIEEAQSSIMKRKYLYTTNFAVNNAKYEVSPYVALVDIYDINLKYLDTIQKSLSPQVAKSLYGKKLNQYISERKKFEK